MIRILSMAQTEFRISLRNRWVAVSVVMMAVFSIVLAAAGSAPSGTVGVDRLSVTVASLTSLGVYLVPLLAHVAVLALAVGAGYGLAALAIWVWDARAVAGLPALWRLTWSSVVLGAVFLGAGYALSAMSRRPSGAAGLAIGLWLGVIVLWDLGLLAALVADNGGWFTTDVFPVALLANPADAFRLYNLAASEAGAAAAGLAGAANAIPPGAALASLLLWPLAALGLALAAFRKVTP
jgi:Cu-processing system permease protein